MVYKITLTLDGFTSVVGQGIFGGRVRENVEKIYEEKPYLKGLNSNRHLRFLNAKDHGYMLLDLSEKEAKCTWVFMRTVQKPTLKTKPFHSWAFPHNGRGLEKRRP